MPTTPDSTPEPQLLQSIPTLEKEPPAESLRHEGYAFYIIIAAVLVLGAVVAAIIIRRKARKLPAPPTAEEIAYREIEELQAQAPTMRECCQGLSLILRRYLTGSTQDPALYETQEEFRQRMDAMTGIPAECQYRTRKHLDTLAEYKYAGEKAASPQLMATLMQETCDIIHSIAEAQVRAALAAAQLAKMKKLS